MSIPFYSNKDIEEKMDIKDCIDVIEKAFSDFDAGNSTMPEKIYLDLPHYSGDFRAMPAYDKRYNIAGIKWVNSHKNNPKIGLPSVSATMIVNNPETAEIIAILEAGILTAIRTGAAGAVAANIAASKDASHVAFIGAGRQAQTQFDCLEHIRNITHVSIADPNPNTVQQLSTHIQLQHSAKIQSHVDVKSAVKDADIIVMTTPSRTPLLQLKDVKPGAHINAIGADAVGKQECDHECIKHATVIVDDINQAAHSGEINTAITQNIITRADIFATLGELINQKKTLDPNNTTLFDSTGLAVQDMALVGYFLNQVQS